MESESAQPQLIGTIDKRPNKMALSSNQKLLAMACDKKFSSFEDKLIVYDATTCNKKFKLDLPETIIDMRFSNDNAELHLITVSFDCNNCNNGIEYEYKFFVIKNESGTIVKCFNLDIIHTPEEFAQYAPKIWSDSLWGFTKQLKSRGFSKTGQYRIDTYIIFLLKALYTHNFDSVKKEQLCSAETTRCERLYTRNGDYLGYGPLYAVSPDGNYLVYCPSVFELSIMDIHTKQRIRSIEINKKNHLRPWDIPPLDIRPCKIFIANDQSLIIESLNYFAESPSNLECSVSQSIYKTIANKPQKILTRKSSSRSFLELKARPLNITISPHSTFAMLQTKFLRECRKLHTFQIIDFSNPDTNLEFLDKYKFCERAAYERPYPVAIGNTTLAFPILSKSARDIKPAEFCLPALNDETIIGIFNITNVIKSAS
jgi:hypothetical protein